MHYSDTDTPDPTLESPFAALRAEMAGFNTPPGVGKQLMAAFAQQQQRPRRWYRSLSAPRWAIFGGAAVAALLALTLALHAPSQPAADAATVLAARDDGAFIALASFERIEQDPAPRMVEATVPRASLASLGVPVSPENAGDLVLAEMLVGADGQPLALRLAL
jgi:anti-sigma-K factor RskA